MNGTTITILIGAAALGVTILLAIIAAAVSHGKQVATLERLTKSHEDLNVNAKEIPLLKQEVVTLRGAFGTLTNTVGRMHDTLGELGTLVRVLDKTKRSRDDVPAVAVTAIRPPSPGAYRRSEPAEEEREDR